MRRQGLFFVVLLILLMAITASFAADKAKQGKTDFIGKWKGAFTAASGKAMVDLTINEDKTASMVTTYSDSKTVTETGKWKKIIKILRFSITKANDKAEKGRYIEFRRYKDSIRALGNAYGEGGLKLYKSK